jgi:carboxyl-terminal processing protease
MHIYIAKNGTQTGPFSVEQINGMLTGGLVFINDLAWHDGASDWQPLHALLGLAQPPPVPVAAPTPRPILPPLLKYQLPQSIEKPKKVGIAVKLVYATLAVGAMRSIWEIPARARQFETSWDTSPLSSQSLIGFSILVMLLTLSFLGYLVYMIDKGRNWARITFLVLLIIGIPFSIIPLLLSFAYSPISGILSVAQVVAQTVAVILLFQKESSRWFLSAGANKFRSRPPDLYEFGLREESAVKAATTLPLPQPLISAEVSVKSDSRCATAITNKEINRSSLRYAWIIAACLVLGVIVLAIITTNKKSDVSTIKSVDRNQVNRIQETEAPYTNSSEAASTSKEVKPDEQESIMTRQQSDVERLQADSDFNEVGKNVVIMLQNTHYLRLPYNEELSQRFFVNYLKDLDCQRLYFTQKDVADLKTKYGGQLHTLLLHGDFMAAAAEIYGVFEKRVDERAALTETLLHGLDFDFSRNESVIMSRRNASWPKDDKEAADLWRLQIKKAVLGEIMRHDSLSKDSSKYGRFNHDNAERNPKEKVLLRYKRFYNNVKEVDEEEIANIFLSAVARAYDPHTDYLSFREMGRAKDSLKNELAGIGVSFQSDEDGATKITGIVIGGPADREGTLKLNDRIVAVDKLNNGKPEDNTDIVFMKIDKLVDLIRGKDGSALTLMVEPSGGLPEETRIIVLHRGMVEKRDEEVSGELIEMKTNQGEKLKLGFISIPSFYEDFGEGKVRCSVDFERILNRLNEEKIDGLVIDLRNNGGGSLEEVRRMTGFFIHRGPVVQVKNSLGKVQSKDSDNTIPIYSGPMVVLTDKNTAFASEIFAGALQDYNRVIVVGDSSTFGGGTVRQPMDIGRMVQLPSAKSRPGYLSATIQKFYRPSGLSTQVYGVKSDIVVPSLMDAFQIGEAYLEHHLLNDRISPAPGFLPWEENAPIIPRLKELSHRRVNTNTDFSYVLQDCTRTKERIKSNELSLNKITREMEYARFVAIQHERDVERKMRFEKLIKEDMETFRFFKVTLENLQKSVGLIPYDPASESVKQSESKESDEAQKWPNRINPVKREAIMIARDLVISQK